MNKFVIAAFVALLSGCAQMQSFAPNAQEHFTALRNFTYQADDERDEWIAYERIDSPFKGDCEDFAFTLQRKIGGEVWYVLVPDYGAHAALVKDGFVYDNLIRTPRTAEEWKVNGSKFIAEMKGKKKPIVVQN